MNQQVLLDPDHRAAAVARSTPAGVAQALFALLHDFERVARADWDVLGRIGGAVASAGHRSMDVRVFLWLEEKPTPVRLELVVAFLAGLWEAGAAVESSVVQGLRLYAENSSLGCDSPVYASVLFVLGAVAERERALPSDERAALREALRRHRRQLMATGLHRGLVHFLRRVEE